MEKPALKVLYLLASRSYVLTTPALYLALLPLTISVETLQSCILDYLFFSPCVFSLMHFIHSHGVIYHLCANKF